MRRKSTDTQQQIIQAAYTLFYKTGFMRTGVDAIADKAGVTKRTVYQHYSSKDDLIGAVLEYQHQIAVERIQRWADHMTGEPEQMVRTLFDKLAQWADSFQWQGSGFTRAAVEFAELPGHPARKAARRQKDAVEKCLIEKFSSAELDNVEQLVQEIMVLIEGCQTLTLIHNRLEYIEAARRAALVMVRNYKLPSSEDV